MKLKITTILVALLFAPITSAVFAQADLDMWADPETTEQPDTADDPVSFFDRLPDNTSFSGTFGPRILRGDHKDFYGMGYGFAFRFTYNIESPLNPADKIEVGLGVDYKRWNDSENFMGDIFENKMSVVQLPGYINYHLSSLDWSSFSPFISLKGGICRISHTSSYSLYGGPSESFSQSDSEGCWAVGGGARRRVTEWPAPQGIDLGMEFWYNNDALGTGGFEVSGTITLDF